LTVCPPPAPLVFLVDAHSPSIFIGAKPRPLIFCHHLISLFFLFVCCSFLCASHFRGGGFGSSLFGLFLPTCSPFPVFAVSVYQSSGFPPFSDDPSNFSFFTGFFPRWPYMASGSSRHSNLPVPSDTFACSVCPSRLDTCSGGLFCFSGCASCSFLIPISSPSVHSPFLFLLRRGSSFL